MANKTEEHVYIVERQNDSVICSGTIERTVAEREGIRHLTVIIVPFIADGENKGNWIVHNRHDKQKAKNKISPMLSINLFGGHCCPSDGDIIETGSTVNESLLLHNAVREMTEELFERCSSQDTGAIALEDWSKGFPDCSIPIYGRSYNMPECSLIPIGYADYTSKNNVECSYLFALPIPCADIDKLIAADDYQRKDGSKGTVCLPILIKTERELFELSKADSSDVEICDAITRLWELQNKNTYQRLIDFIDRY